MRTNRRGEITIVELLVILGVTAILIITTVGVYSAIAGRRKVDERVLATDNPEYQVTHLFTTDDGIKVYRFYDYGQSGYVYFTSRNDVNWTTTKSDGETTTTYHHQMLGN